MSERNGKIKVEFRYVDGSFYVREFDTDKEIGWFAYNEGDHLVEYVILERNK